MAEKNSPRSMEIESQDQPDEELPPSLHINALDRAFGDGLISHMSELTRAVKHEVSSFFDNLSKELYDRQKYDSSFYLDEYLLKRKILSRDMLWEFINLLKKYRLERSTAPSNEPGPSTAHQSATISKKEIEESVKELHMTVFKMAGIKVPKTGKLRRMMEFERLKENLKDCIKDTEMENIVKALKINSETIEKCPKTKKFLQELRQKAKKDDPVKLMTLCMDEIVKYRKRAVFDHAKQIYDKFVECKKKMKGRKNMELYELQSLEVLDIDNMPIEIADIHEMLIGMHKIMYTLMSDDLDFITEKMEKNFADEAYDLQKLEKQGGEQHFFAYNGAKETILLAKCVDYSVHLKTRYEHLLPNLNRLAAFAILDRPEGRIEEAAKRMMNILKMPEETPKDVELKYVFLQGRQHRYTKFLRPRLSEDTLYGVNEILDEVADETTDKTTEDTTDEIDTPRHVARCLPIACPSIMNKLKKR